MVIGLLAHFLLQLTWVMTALAVPRSAGSLHRFDHRIFFSTNGVFLR